ncbi:unnamed protein product [Pseudo-nitzschia multistriata]|uniref:Peptidyl-prolyl cis-trans isomerase n=1 Tax=Pseudo-nitzschia multistriata TaxID=183589 RepID=A0A448YZX6_9STRA|nr:unnamed protein product [Pseudo-nitzschia multistriata]
MTISTRLSNLVVFFLCLVSASREFGFASAFSPTGLPQSSLVSPKASVAGTTTRVGMGMFDFIQNAFKNEEYDDRLATASHILVDTEQEALVIMKEIEEGQTTFSEAAKTYSNCPSSSKGGSLGQFAPGTMVQAFDDVVFDENVAIGSIQGPVSTQFGCHLIVVEDRTVNNVRSEGDGFF